MALFVSRRKTPPLLVVNQLVSDSLPLVYPSQLFESKFCFRSLCCTLFHGMGQTDRRLGLGSLDLCMSFVRIGRLFGNPCLVVNIGHRDGIWLMALVRW